MEKICEIVVIGGGGSGLVAAARAAEVSGTKVIVLEKAKFTGGGMLFASTMRTFRSQWQKERNIPDQSVPFIRSMMDLTLWRLDPALVRSAVLGTGQFFDWYSQYEKPEVMAQYHAAPYVFDIPVNGQPGPQIDGFHNGSGRVIMETMVRVCSDLGVEILTGSPAVDVELSGGRISAVIAQTPDGPVKIHCKSCILACGSWICNKEITDRVMPEFNQCDVLPSAHQNPAYTGDGIPMAQKAGALIDWDSFCLRIMGPICGMGDHSRFDALTRSDCVVLVDLNGERFVAEPMAPRIDPFDTGHILIKHPKGKTFFLYSANTMRHIIQESRAGGTASGPFAMEPLPELTEIDRWFQEALAAGKTELGMADTIEGLALQIGLDPAKLRHTIDAYNTDCRNGEDTRCFKEKGLIPLAEGPYYALSGKLATDGAFGGVLVNERMQAYSNDGQLVSGLYVTGDFASGRHIVLDGIKRQVLNDMSWALSSGFIAGTNAAADLAGPAV